MLSLEPGTIPDGHYPLLFQTGETADGEPIIDGPRDFSLIEGFQTGIGANVSFYATPEELEPFYGNSPKGFFLYFRIRKGHGGH